MLVGPAEGSDQDGPGRHGPVHGHARAELLDQYDLRAVVAGIAPAVVVPPAAPGATVADSALGTVGECQGPGIGARGVGDRTDGSGRPGAQEVFAPRVGGAQ